MKPVKQIILNVPEPCSQNWNEMIAAGNNKFCNHCSKTIIDFSQMSDSALLRYIQEAASGSICGRFSSNQLNRPLHQLHQPQQFSYRLLYAFLSLGLTAFSITDLQARSPATQYESSYQAKENDTSTWASGYVKDFYSGKSAPGIQIYLLYNGSDVARTETDFYGFYKMLISETYLNKQLNIRSGATEQRFVVKKGNNSIDLRYHALQTSSTDYTDMIMGIAPLNAKAPAASIGGPRIPQTVYIIDGVPVKNSHHKKNFFRRLMFWK